MRAARAVLTDIEGTTTPISFVTEVLFPYAEARLEAACARAAEETAFAEAVDLLRHEHRAEPPGEPPAFGGGAPYARWLMAQDRKSTGLKKLQGLIWRQGYRDGTLRAQVFADVPPNLERWRRRGLRLRVYSSGSVLAQKLLFAHTDHGDLTGCFEGYHDTTTGPKKEAYSYRAIAASFGLPPAQVLFLSDVEAELDAAAAAGMTTALLERPGNPPVEHTAHPRCADFDQVHEHLGLPEHLGP